jgi:hypothetical protein
LPKNAVVVSFPKGSSTAIKSAAEDLKNGLEKIFPDDIFAIKEGYVPKPNPKPNPKTETETDPEQAEESRCILIDVEGEGAQESFRISKVSPSTLRIAGADTLGAVYGIYALLEHYGCGFYLTYDTYPTPEKGKWRLPESDLADRPLCIERYSFNWHNFLSGCSAWNLEDWKDWIDRSRKMRYNVIMVHAYGNNPMFTFEFNGVKKPVGWLASTDRGRDWGTAHVNDVRRMIGGENFDGPVFGASPALLPPEQEAEATQKMMKEVFSHAKAQGVKVAFQLDIDVEHNYQDSMMAFVPENERIKTNEREFPNPESPTGRAYYKAIFNSLMELYPEINPLVICHRTEPAMSTVTWQVQQFDIKSFPVKWQQEYNDILKSRKWENPEQLARYFWLGKVVKTIQEIAYESGRDDLVISQATWRFKNTVPYADACSPKNVALLNLDYNELNNKPEFSTPEGIEWLSKITASGRRIVPIIWSHHDDGNYIGRSHTPFENFATILEQGGFDSYGIIHWTLRPHGLYFKSHSVQTWQTTKNQPLIETCKTMARDIFGNENDSIGGAYLYDWITKAPIFGRETGDYMIDRVFTPEKCDEYRKEGERRLELLGRVGDNLKKSPENEVNSARNRHLAYWTGLEEFNLSFWTNETLLQQSVKASNVFDDSTAKYYIKQANPEATIKKYEEYASQLGLTRGDLGILTLMNLRWLPAFIGQRQMVGLDAVRINYGPRVREKLAGGAGKRTFFIDKKKRMWIVHNGRETQGEVWSVPHDSIFEGEEITETEREIFRTGVYIDDFASLFVVPAMQSFFASKKTINSPPGRRMKLSIYVADPEVEEPEDSEFDILMISATRKSYVLSTISPKPGVAEIYRFYIPENSGYFAIAISSQYGKASVCGITLDMENRIYED